MHPLVKRLRLREQKDFSRLEPGKLVYDYDYRGFPINEDVGNYLETPGVYKVVMIQGEKIKTSTIEKL